MRSSREIMADLARSGLSADQQVLLMELVAATVADARPAADEAAERRRAKDRDRKRLRNSADSTEGAEGEKGPNIPQKSAEIRRNPDPLACVEENLLPKEIITNSLSFERVRDCAGDALASIATHPGIATMGPLLALLKGDTPCLPDEILDGVTKSAAWYRAKGPPGQMKSWDLARKMALEHRDARLAGPPAPKEPHERPSPNRPSGFTDHQRSRADANFAGAALALERRRRAGEPADREDDPGGSPRLALISG